MDICFCKSKNKIETLCAKLMDLSKKRLLDPSVTSWRPSSHASAQKLYKTDINRILFLSRVVDAMTLQGAVYLMTIITRSIQFRLPVDLKRPDIMEYLALHCVEHIASQYGMINADFISEVRLMIKAIDAKALYCSEDQAILSEADRAIRIIEYLIDNPGFGILADLSRSCVNPAIAEDEKMKGLTIVEINKDLFPDVLVLRENIKDTRLKAVKRIKKVEESLYLFLDVSGSSSMLDALGRSVAESLIYDYRTVREQKDLDDYHISLSMLRCCSDSVARSSDAIEVDEKLRITQSHMIADQQRLAFFYSLPDVIEVRLDSLYACYKPGNINRGVELYLRIVLPDEIQRAFAVPNPHITLGGAPPLTSAFKEEIKQYYNKTGPAKVFVTAICEHERELRAKCRKL